MISESQNLKKLKEMMNVNEDVFNFSSKNSSLLKEIDEEFKYLLDSYNPEKSDFDLDKDGIKKVENNIINVVKKLFNAKMKFKFFEPKMGGKFTVKNVAYTVVTQEQVSNIVEGITKIVMEEKNGIYYSNPREIDVFMELSSLRHFMEKKSNGKEGFTDFNERYCTYILLHEIGHNLYFPIEINVLSKGKTPTFELKYKNSKPAQFQYTKDIEDDTRRNRIAAKPMIIAMTILIASLASLKGVAELTLGVGAASAMFLSFQDGSRLATMNYNLSERSANQLPTLYGYSVEMVKFYDLIYKAFSQKSETKGKNKISKTIRGLFYPLRLFVRSYKDYPTDSIDTLIKTLKFEISNANNNEKARKELKKQLREIEILIKNSKNLNTNIG